MRDLLISCILFSLMPISYRRPYVGLLAFSWLAYMRPQDLTYSFARGLRWSFYMAIVMFAGYFMKPRGRFFLPDVRTGLFCALAIFIGIGIFFGAEVTERQISRYIEFVKIIGIALFTLAVVTNRERLRALMWIIALSLGFYGVKNGVWGVLTLGQTHVLRGPGGMLLDNNDFALALAMAVPMLFQIGWTERHELMRKAFWITVPLTMLTVGLTRSRGGFLSLSAAVGVLVWRSKNRVAGMMIAGLVGIVGLILAPPEYKERLMTIVDYDSESSAKSRLRAWGIAIRMAAANPIFGVGFGRFPKHFVEFCHDPTPNELAGKGVIVAHNSYLQIWAECGTPAILMYFALVLASFVTIWKVRAMAKRRFDTSWILNYATMFEASLFCFLVGSTFLNRAHFDLFYHFVAIIMAFGYIARRDMLTGETGVYRKSGSRARLRQVLPRGFDRKDALAGLGGAYASREA